LTVSQKAALSLLISVFLFAGVAVLAFTGLFDLVEARFYNPSITKSLTREIEADTETIQNFISEFQGRFAAALTEPAVRRSFLPNQSAEDIFERTRIYGILLETTGGLHSVRFVDAGGQRIHFSTYSQDILSQDRFSIAFRNYNEGPGNLPYEQVQNSTQGDVKLILDEAGDRIIFSFPFYDSFDVYRGTALFTVSVRAVAERLVSANRIKIGENVSIISAPSGIVSGIPGAEKEDILAKVSEIWSGGLLTLTPLDSAASGTSLALISSRTSQGINVGRLMDETLFSFPQSMKVILLVSIFMTIYLSIFLVFNLRQDTMTVIQNRLKNLQISLIEQYYDRKGDADWTHWARELEQRREDIRAEVKQGVRSGMGRRAEEDIDTLIDKSWDELLAVIGSRKPATAGIDEEKLQTILNRILLAVPAGTAAAIPQAIPNSKPAEEVVEEVEELGDADEVEELEELTEEPEPAELLEEADLQDTPHAGGLLAAAAAKKETNVELAFGDDDIPYVVETSGLELMDGEIDSAIETMRTDDEPAELEELEELDEVEDLEVLEDLNPAEDGPAGDSGGGSSRPSESDLAELASTIEFSSPDPIAEEPDDDFDEDLEIVSPFASMLSDFDDADENILQDPETAVKEESADPAAEDEKKND
jgi:hypothetical protein